MIRIENKTFGNENVELDGKEFINCTFNGSNWIFTGKAAFGMRGIKAINLTLEFSGAAGMTIQVLELLYKTGGTHREAVESVLKTITGSGSGPTQH